MDPDAARACRLTAGVAAAFVVATTLEAQANPSDGLPVSMRAIGYQSYLTGGYADNTQGPVLDYIETIGANWVLLNTPFIVDSATSTIAPGAGVTDFDGLPVAIRRLKQRGLKIALHVATETPSYGSVCQEGGPRNVDEFFRGIGALTIRYADLAERESVELLVINSELDCVTGPDFLERWTAIISEIRAHYHGKITYSTLPDPYAPPTVAEVNSRVSFWSQLDFISFSLYPARPEQEVATREELYSAWRVSQFTRSRILRNLKAWQTVTGKKVIITKVGYSSRSGAATNPGIAPGARGSLSEALQALWYDVMFDEVSEVSQEGAPWLEGLVVWGGVDTRNRNNARGYYRGGPEGRVDRATDYSVFEKEAAAVVRRWFGGRVSERAAALPPWEDTIDFRGRLERTFRDVLREPPIATRVDVDGSALWTHEYLKFRLSGCNHASSVFRVQVEIDSGDAPALCGQAASGERLPPDEDIVGFTGRLEQLYREVLSRSVSETYVDRAALARWFGEYFRLRLGGCGHRPAAERVLMTAIGLEPAATCP